MPHSSRGLGHRPLKAEITGSNPVCGTKFAHFGPIHHHDDARIGAFSLATESVVPLSVPYPKDTEGKKTVLTEDTRTRTSTSSSLTTGFVDVLELEHVG